MHWEGTGTKITVNFFAHILYCLGKIVVFYEDIISPFRSEVTFMKQLRLDFFGKGRYAAVLPSKKNLAVLITANVSWETMEIAEAINYGNFWWKLGSSY